MSQEKKRPDSAKTGRMGINKIEAAILKLGHIWREQPIEDVGVDGIVELCIDQYPTGKLVGVQAKSGESYFERASDSGFTYYLQENDIDYWQKLILPLIIVFYHPVEDALFWIDISNHIDLRGNWPIQRDKIFIPYSNKVDATFDSHIKRLFNLVIPSDQEFENITKELQSITWSNNDHGITITALDLFINGLWGLCTKLLFHLSLLTDAVKKKIIKRNRPSAIRLQLERSSLQVFIISYLRLLKKYSLADFDSNDVNHTIYVKWEWPTFIAPLTVGGKKYVEFLRKKFADREVCDQQFFNLLYIPHVFIEVFDNFYLEEKRMGNPLRSMLIYFNRYLNDFILQDITWTSYNPETVNMQHISFEELRYYISQNLKDVPKDNIVLRHQDEFISPIVCWLEEFTDNSQPFSIDDLKWESMVDKSGLAYEMHNTFSFGTMSYEAAFPDFIDVGQLWINQHVQREHYNKVQEIMKEHNKKVEGILSKHKNDSKPQS